MAMHYRYVQKSSVDYAKLCFLDINAGEVKNPWKDTNRTEKVDEGQIDALD
jgi:hypothetical protein